MATFALNTISYLYKIKRNLQANIDISSIKSNTKGVLKCY